MKTSKHIIKTALFAATLSFASCSDRLLDEVPLDFYSPENSFVTPAHFEAALYSIYDDFRGTFYRGSNQGAPPRILFQGTDMVFSDGGLGEFPDFSKRIVPTAGFVFSAVWEPCYRMIYDANVIIGRADDPDTELTEDQKTKVKAEARFFRALMHKTLADLYGGVPIVLEETLSPKRDYVRASREEVYEQCAEDFSFAAAHLPDIDQAGDFRLNKLAAYHLLAETYISLKRWQEAVDAASEVIDHPATALMTERFGRRMNDPVNPDFPWASGGDVYWDLFRKGNQARSAGNTEAIWVLPFEYNVDGGAAGGSGYELIFAPRLWSLSIRQDVNVIPHPNTYYGGRGGGQIRLTHYFYNGLWARSGEDDIRNASHNIVRDFKVNNPVSAHHGKWILADNVPIRLNRYADTTRDFFPLMAKIASLGDHPKDVWNVDQTVTGSLLSSSAAGGLVTNRDHYRIRLAETYLLRAEAYLGMGDQGSAANDINVVRRRSNAPDVDPSEVDIDYILDERLRELYTEEFRLLTLTRLGKLVERTRKYNPEVGNTYEDHQNLWPIPYSEIEKNTEAELTQNPGYSN
ncbi:MAG: RagB/SusD family nutrient uptake outer membrane protein [Solitalea sp.]